MVATDLWKDTYSSHYCTLSRPLTVPKRLCIHHCSRTTFKLKTFWGQSYRSSKTLSNVNSLLDLHLFLRKITNTDTVKICFQIWTEPNGVYITCGYLMVHLKMNGWQAVWIESKAKIYSVQKRKFLVNFWIEFTDFRIEAQLYHEKHRIGLL